MANGGILHTLYTKREIQYVPSANKGGQHRLHQLKCEAKIDAKIRMLSHPPEFGHLFPKEGSDVSQNGSARAYSTTEYWRPRQRKYQTVERAHSTRRYGDPKASGKINRSQPCRCPRAGGGFNTWRSSSPSASITYIVRYGFLSSWYVRRRTTTRQTARHGRHSSKHFMVRKKCCTAGGVRFDHIGICQRYCTPDVRCLNYIKRSTPSFRRERGGRNGLFKRLQK